MVNLVCCVFSVPVIQSLPLPMNVRIHLRIACLLLSLWGLRCGSCAAQMPLADTMAINATLPAVKQIRQQDIVDVLKRRYPRLPITLHDSATLHEGKHFLLVIPQVGYTLPVSYTHLTLPTKA